MPGGRNPDNPCPNRSHRIPEDWTLEYELRVKAGMVAKKRQYRKYGVPIDPEAVVWTMYTDSPAALTYFCEQFDRAYSLLWCMAITGFKAGYPHTPEDLSCYYSPQPL